VAQGAPKTQLTKSVPVVVHMYGDTHTEAAHVQFKLDPHAEG
jgi:hypothetical protein